MACRSTPRPAGRVATTAPGLAPPRWRRSLWKRLQRDHPTMENGPDGKLYIVSLGRGSNLIDRPQAKAVPDADGDTVRRRVRLALPRTQAPSPSAEVPRLRVTVRPRRSSTGSAVGDGRSGTTYTDRDRRCRALRRKEGSGGVARCAGLPPRHLSRRAPTRCNARRPTTSCVREHLWRRHVRPRQRAYPTRGVRSMPPCALCLGSEPSGGAMINFRVSGES